MTGVKKNDTGARGIAAAMALLLPVVFGVCIQCTDAGLKLNFEENITYYDNKMDVIGEFCASPADELAFPVKLLIVIDQSASLQCTDPGNNRLTALNEAGQELDALPNVEFGVIGFASWSRITNFTTDWSAAAAALAPQGGQGGPATDYQGALSVVLTMLEQDMIAAGPAMRARTRYVVLFLSDGVPEPRCTFGCDDGNQLPDSLYGVCNTDQEIPDDVYVDMTGVCPDYNKDWQISAKVEDIMSLGEFYGVGDLTFNSIFLFAPEAEVAAVCGDVASTFGYNRNEAMPLLQGMAQVGRGTFRDVNLSTDIDFLDYNYESLKAPYRMMDLYAVNMSAIPSENGYLADSDGDGLADEVEYAMGLDRQSRDSDGDNYSDLLEHMFRRQGFDPSNPTLPVIFCSDAQDRDGDGLNACEEAFLKTDPLFPDTDADGIVDGIELRFGLDPTVDDVSLDHDFDGIPSGLEVKYGTHPQLYDEEDFLSERIFYGVTQTPASADITCYDYGIKNLTLSVPMPILGETANGTNRIRLFLQEEPEGMAGSRGQFWTSCVEARYLGDTYKDPPGGEISPLSNNQFVRIQEFETDGRCYALNNLPREQNNPFDMGGKK
ncbi:MAG: VWA domain-containing protein [Deltaproteobacteria bacterium]|nr:VWA domain-containing protein [Deltaproteobacteria bacterium]